MLKITTETKTGMTKITLEGKLAGPWVNELALCWQAAAAQSPNSVQVNLASVTFIDEEGKALLMEMYRSGVELVANGCMNRCVIEKIISSVEERKRKI
ncbi:MAG: hypothetical protein LLH30_16605 [Candidatus Manganitrophus sp. SA1]|nr:hypothetical protein [Candidatus Manganitrophus morganii]